jgi:hypothetical protein
MNDSAEKKLSWEGKEMRALLVLVYNFSFMETKAAIVEFAKKRKIEKRFFIS